MIQNDLNLILPEILLSIFAMLALLFGVYRDQDKKTASLTLATAGLMLIVGMWMILGGSSSEAAFNNMFISDAFSRYAKALILLSSAAVPQLDVSAVAMVASLFCPLSIQGVLCSCRVLEAFHSSILLT